MYEKEEGESRACRAQATAPLDNEDHDPIDFSLLDYSFAFG